MPTWIVVGVAVLLAAAVAAWHVLIASHDGRQDIDLRRWVEAEDPWTQAVVPGARWATDELCDDEMPCIQAITSETLTMYRFDKRDDAVAAAESFGEDGHLTGWIAVRYEPGRLTVAQRNDFEYGIGCINIWVSEDGHDC